MILETQLLAALHNTNMTVLIAGLKNILRGCLLGFLATFFGCFLFFTLPDLVASKINRQLPYWFYANEVSCALLICLVLVARLCGDLTRDWCAAESPVVPWYNPLQLLHDRLLPVTYEAANQCSNLVCNDMQAISV